MTNSAQHYCLRWNNHMTNFAAAVAQLLKSEEFTDVTVAVDGGSSIKCHKMVLAACSTYFQELFVKNPCEHPIIILSDVKFAEIQAILDYMYRGEVNVAQDQLQGLLKVAAFLKVKGLVEDSESSSSNGKSEQPMMLEPPHSPLTELAHVSAAQAAAEAAVQAATGNGSLANGGYPTSPLPHVAAPFSVPFGKSAHLDSRSAMALWPALAGLHHHHQMPQHPISGHQPPPRGSILAGAGGSSYENSSSVGSDISPLRRKKSYQAAGNRDTPILRNVLGGQNECSPLSDRGQDTYSNASNGSMHDSSDRRNSSEHSELMMDEMDEKAPASPHKYGSHDRREQNPNWKRYKQYSREDIANAMLAVSNKEMSALQAASKFKIPSRTLYDKLKKAGILPTRGAGIQRASRSSGELMSSTSSSARFPYSSSMNGSVYGGGAVAANDMSEDGDDGPEVNGYAMDHHHHHHHQQQQQHRETPTGTTTTTTTTATTSPVPPILNGLSLRATVRRPSVDNMDVSGSGGNNASAAGGGPNDDGAEDLSVGSRRSSDHSVVVPSGIKEEDDDERDDETSMHHEES